MRKSPSHSGSVTAALYGGGAAAAAAGSRDQDDSGVHLDQCCDCEATDTLINPTHPICFGCSAPVALIGCTHNTLSDCDAMADSLNASQHDVTRRYPATCVTSSTGYRSTVISSSGGETSSGLSSVDSFRNSTTDKDIQQILSDNEIDLLTGSGVKNLAFNDDVFSTSVRLHTDSCCATSHVTLPAVTTAAAWPSTRTRMHFRRFFEPLRRSHSAGNQGNSHNGELSPVCVAQPDPLSLSRHSTSSVTSSHVLTSNRLQITSESQTVVLTRKSDSQLCTTPVLLLQQPSFSLPSSPAPSEEGKDNKKRSLTSEVYHKLHLIRRRCADLTSTTTATTTSHKPAHETVRNWATSIEHLLGDKFGRQCFSEFLKSEFSEENLQFWIACEDFKNLKTANLSSAAQKIFSEYVAYQAPKEINIDSITREVIYANMAQGASRSMFEPAQKRIQALMDRDSYPRFLQSDLYQFLLNQ